MELLLNLKRVHFSLHGDEPQTIPLSVKGRKGSPPPTSDAVPGAVTNPDQHIADLAGKVSLELEATIERGLGYVPREVLTRKR